MKVLITGTSGKIGSYVLERFADKYDVAGVDLKPYPNAQTVSIILPRFS